jgi:hypothetical protein
MASLGQDLSGIFAWVPKLLPFLQALEGLGVVKTSTGTQITTVAADLAAIASDITGKAPSSQLTSDCLQLVADLKTEGLLGSALAYTLTADISLSKQFLADLHAGQYGVIKANVGIDGVLCAIGAIPYTGAAAQALGLAAQPGT